MRLAPSVDAAWNVASLTFDNTAGAFSIGGPQTITVGAGGVTNNDTGTQTITAAVALGANASFTAAAGGLAIGAVALGGRTLTFTGANDVSLASASGSGTVAKSGAGTLDINGPLGTGGVTVSASTGTTRFHTSQTLNSLTIGAGSTVIFTSGVAAFADSGGGKTSGFGTPASSFGTGSAVVPEPGTIGLLLVGALGVLGRRRRAKFAALRVAL